MRGASPAGPQTLGRRLGLADAIVIGLGSMIGAGIFSALTPAAAAAGSGLLLGLGLAAVIAFCNAASTAQLAAAYPVSGGAYVYGRERLGDWWGFAAGWSFVVGKTASCAAMALTFATYALPGPDEAQRALAIAAVLALAAVNYRGIAKTAALTRVLVAGTLTVLVVLIGALWSGGARWSEVGTWGDLGSGGVYGTLQAAGLLFFAFAGYARIATLGEEVREPARTIPRAIILSLSAVLALYLAVALSALAAGGPALLAGSEAPLAAAVSAAGADPLAPLVRIGAAVASLGTLLALIAGVGRTSLAMARHRDLPSWLAAVHPRFLVPHRAEIALAAVVCSVVLVGDIREVIGFSSFGVLLYYGIANAAALTQARAERRYPRFVNGLGAVGCVTLMAALPGASIAAGLGVLGIGLAGRGATLRLRGRARHARAR